MATSLLRALRYRFPDPEHALAEIAHLSAVLTLPRGTVHVVSDVHGEFRKLEHILRNGSGSLRPLVERLFDGRLDASARATLLNLVYYPRETWARASASLDAPAAGAARAARKRSFMRETVLAEVEILRALAGGYAFRQAARVFPPALAEVMSELFFADALARDVAYVDALLAPFFEDDGGVELLRATAHAVRAFASYEIVVAGDLGDRGPRLDRVIEALRRQTNLSITWGNHDAEWMAACLGQRAAVATVVRISLRYGRIAQLEEGYGIPVEPLELLARAAYGDDPAERFAAKGADLREPILLARMQKAIAILQFKLEAETSRRNPHFGLEGRNLLHRIDPAAGTVKLGDETHPLLDRRFPTIDWADPYRLTDAEEQCIDQLTRSFLASPSLWRDMTFVADRGGMWLARDENLIFHGCVPCDAAGELLEVAIDGAPRKGRALFDALDGVVRRAFRAREAKDVDFLYWLWAGARSPCFGKDKMATFETYFVADKKTHKETKNPYFSLIHDAAFCRKVAREFGIASDAPLIVNGHVPVKLEEGESPLKRSGLAVTIDGAFSEAYGDHGFTLVIGAKETYLAKHHHFDSVDAAIERGADIVPEVQVLRAAPAAVRVADTTAGAHVREEIAALHDLVTAYRTHAF